MNTIAFDMVRTYLGTQVYFTRIIVYYNRALRIQRRWLSYKAKKQAFTELMGLLWEKHIYPIFLELRAELQNLDAVTKKGVKLSLLLKDPYTLS